MAAEISKPGSVSARPGCAVRDAQVTARDVPLPNERRQDGPERTTEMRGPFPECPDEMAGLDTRRVNAAADLGDIGQAPMASTMWRRIRIRRHAVSTAAGG